jgi:hypothetical protein
LRALFPDFVAGCARARFGFVNCGVIAHELRESHDVTARRSSRRTLGVALSHMVMHAAHICCALSARQWPHRKQ